MYIDRTLSVANPERSCFLFGLRQSGKSCLIEHTVESDIYIDLLNSSELTRFIGQPDLLYSEIKALGVDSPLIVIDEIQKAPGILDTVHRAIESEFKARFVLTGSSARKLKRNRANMLGGRALVKHLYPFSFIEAGQYANGMKSFMQFGGIPNVCLAENRTVRKSLLEAYVTTYLKEEIYEESRIRNLPAFTRFLELAGHTSGSVLNYSSISQEIGISSRAVKDYFAMLEDTLLGFMLYPLKSSHRRRIISHPKFYFLDPGIVFALRKMLSVELVEGTQLYGDAFEHLIITEVVKALSYTGREMEMSFFRTYDGAEVDLVLTKHGEQIPVEIKSSRNPRSIGGLKSFLRDHSPRTAYCVCNTPRRYEEHNVIFLPWQDFIADIYSGSGVAGD